MPSFQKRIFNINSFWNAANAAFQTIFNLKKQDGESSIDSMFSERIMLAVTQVNGCRYCSFGHTQAALKSGSSHRRNPGTALRGSEQRTDEEIPALLFAQHYAETTGHPDPKAWEKIVRTYGENNALKILANIRMITIGNLIGNTFDSFLFRITGRPAHPESNFFQELGVLLGTFFIIPAAMIRQKFFKTRDLSPVVQTK